jgi:hypothetical protein
MLSNPEMSFAIVADRRQALVAQADRHRLLSSLRRERKARQVPVRNTRTAATLGECERNVAPAR